jgi:hypothetical protein
LRHAAGCVVAGSGCRTAAFGPARNASKHDGVAAVGAPAFQCLVLARQRALEQVSGKVCTGSAASIRGPRMQSFGQDPVPVAGCRLRTTAVSVSDFLGVVSEGQVPTYTRRSLRRPRPTPMGRVQALPSVQRAAAKRSIPAGGNRTKLVRPELTYVRVQWAARVLNSKCIHPRLPELRARVAQSDQPIAGRCGWSPNSRLALSSGHQPADPLWQQYGNGAGPENKKVSRR